jgi:hypothetical protein
LASSNHICAVLTMQTRGFVPGSVSSMIVMLPPSATHV